MMKIRGNRKLLAVAFLLGFLAGGAIGWSYGLPVGWALFLLAVVAGIFVSLVDIGIEPALNLVIKSEKQILTPIVAKVFILIILLGFLVILGQSVFTSQLDLESGWSWVSLGSAGAAVTAIVNSAEIGARRVSSTGPACFVSYGLALMAESQTLSTFFYITAVFVGLFAVRDSFRTIFLGHSPSEPQQ